MNRRLFSVQLHELNDDGERTGRTMSTVLDAEQLRDPKIDLPGLFELVNEEK